ncbi:DUF397 domain-containing protein [Streptosporangium algeriense]|uniref:DUF397 domain-containing protein n=1 Tax=Streptosporangium algeriense TaxID=1682748 RepID=A0ABW3DQN7_9ACTN
MIPDLTGATFHKSALSGLNGQRAEIATNLFDLVAIRDSKDPSGPTLTFSASRRNASINGVKLGTFTV